MFLNADEVPQNTVIETDICVVGSGPAGLSFAREFEATGVRVAILESGALDIDDFAVSLTEGEVVGLPYPDLTAIRQRVFGGAGIHWGGNVRHLEASDYDHRPEIGREGWPFSQDTLRPYYKRALEFFGLPSNSFDRAHWSKKNGKPWRFKDRNVVSQIFHTVGEDTYDGGKYWRQLFRSSRNIRVYLSATVVDIVADADVRRIEKLEVAKRDRTRFTVRATQFVLATGGIENARLLLLCDKQQKAGLGNDNGHVGKYFQEHLTNPNFAFLIPSDPHLNLGFYKGQSLPWGDAWGVLRLSDEILKKHALSNIRFQLATITNTFNENIESDGMVSLGRLADPSNMFPNEDILKHVANVIADIDYVASAGYERLTKYPNYPMKKVDVVGIGEQLPNASSQVRLGRERDVLGQQRVVLDWQVTETDNDIVRKTVKLLAQFVGQSKIGRIVDQIPPGVFADVPPKPHFHHMGTTRMHDNPKKGVVDGNSRIHRLENLFVAGSSVFPSSGNANPTYTIVALAIRLADHLKKVLGR